MHFMREMRSLAHGSEAASHCDAWWLPPFSLQPVQAEAYPRSDKLPGHVLVQLWPPLQEQVGMVSHWTTSGSWPIVLPITSKKISSQKSASKVGRQGEAASADEPEPPGRQRGRALTGDAS